MRHERGTLELPVWSRTSVDNDTSERHSSTGGVSRTTCSREPQYLFAPPGGQVCGLGGVFQMMLFRSGAVVLVQYHERLVGAAYAGKRAPDDNSPKGIWEVQKRHQRKEPRHETKRSEFHL